jgi:putative transposase
MLDATRIRLYPTDQQAQALAVQFGCARWVWNNALAETGKLYLATGKGLNYHAMAIRLPKLKQEFEWLGDADSQVLQQSLQNLSRGFENFFQKRGKYPRFKSKIGRQSVQYPQRVKIELSRIYLPKVGWVKCIVHREIIGKFKTVAVSRSACGQFHAAVLTDNGDPMPAISTNGKAIGVDVGLTHLAVTSDGSKFANPRHLRKAERNLKRKQRKLSRKKKGSNGRNKARRLVARAHERVACARRDHLHKLSRRIVNENQVVVVEDLHVKGIMANHSLAKATADAGWGMFTGFLEYKAARAGKAFLKCDRWYPSSKTCSACGSICDKMPLDVRAWTCAHCSAHHDRDINAAINIRAEGLRILAGGAPASAGGGDVSPRARRSPRARQSPTKPEASAFRRR